MGVDLKGTPENQNPFSWYGGARGVTEDGLRYGNTVGPDIESNLQVLCTYLVDRQRRVEVNKAFNPKEACESLHEFVQSLPG